MPHIAAAPVAYFYSAAYIFSKLKTLLRKANERTVEATWRRIGKLLDEFSPNECANYLVNSGYAPC